MTDSESKAQEYILSAQQGTTPKELIDGIRNLQELLINQAPNLLSTYGETLLTLRLHQASNAEVRKNIAAFAEVAAKKSPEVAPLAVGALADMLVDAPRALATRIIAATSTIYRAVLGNISESTNEEYAAGLWNNLERLRNGVLQLLTTDVTPIRNAVTKFAEIVVLGFTSPPRNAPPEKFFNTGRLAAIHSVLNKNWMSTEAKTIVTKICEGLSENKSPQFAISSLSAMAKARPIFIDPVVPTLLGIAEEKVIKGTADGKLKASGSSIKIVLRKEILMLLRVEGIETGPHRDRMVEVIDEIGTKDNIVEANTVLKDIDIRFPWKRKGEKRRKVEEYDMGGVSAPAASTLSDLGLLGTLLGQAQPVVPLPTATRLAKHRDPRQRRRDPRLAQPATQPIEDVEMMPVIEVKEEVMEEDPVVPAAPLSAFGKQHKLLKLLLGNVKRSRTFAFDAGGADVWETGISRLAAFAAGIGGLNERIHGRVLLDEPHIVRESIKSVASDIAECSISVVASFLHTVYLADEQAKIPEDPPQDCIYSVALSSIIERRKVLEMENMDIDKHIGTWSEFALEVPRLIDALKDAIYNIAADEAEMDVILPGQRALVSVILKRPVDRQWAIDALCRIATSDSSQEIRTAALLVLTRHVYSMEGKGIKEIVTQIEKTTLRLLQQASEKKNVEGDDEFAETRRFMMPFLLLCARNHELLLELPKMYLSMGTIAKTVLQGELHAIVGTIGTDSPAFVELVEQNIAGAEQMVLHILHVVTDEAPPPPALSQAVQQLYSKTGDPRLLVSIIHSLESAKVVKHLPQLIKLGKDVTAAALGRIIQFDAMKPADLLFELHVLKNDTGDKGLLVRLMNAIEVCLSPKFSEKVTRSVLSAALKRLIALTALPKLLLRTMIQVHQRQKELTPFIIGLLSQLVGKKVWMDDTLWEGFIILCMKTLPGSYDVLLQLPQEQLQSACNDAPKFSQKPIDLKVLVTNHAKKHKTTLAPEVSLFLFGPKKVDS